MPCGSVFLCNNSDLSLSSEMTRKETVSKNKKNTMGECGTPYPYCATSSARRQAPFLRTEPDDPVRLILETTDKHAPYFLISTIIVHMKMFENAHSKYGSRILSRLCTISDSQSSVSILLPSFHLFRITKLDARQYSTTRFHKMTFAMLFSEGGMFTRELKVILQNVAAPNSRGISFIMHDEYRRDRDITPYQKVIVKRLILDSGATQASVAGLFRPRSAVPQPTTTQNRG